jgi:hypothetical protein
MVLARIRRILFATAFVVAVLPAPRIHAQDHSAEADQLISTFQKIENNWSDAINTHNQFELENTLSKQFVGISAQGTVTNRDQQIAMLFNKQLAPRVLQQTVVTVRSYAGADGADIAVVSGTYVLKVKDGKGIDDERGIFTHIFLHTRTMWSCINAQNTIIINQLLPKTKLEQPKK